MKTLFLLSLLAFITVSFALSEQELAQTFEEWVNKHGKIYNEDEVLYRFRIFSQNVEFVNKHNSEDHSFKVGLNRFADLSNTEFMERYAGLHTPRFHDIDPARLYVPEQNVGLPASVDWSVKGIVTPVKDQGQCGSCWSFSTTGSVEGAWALNHSLVSLSEQNLMDCSRSYGNYGCGGGWMDSAFQYIIDNGGIDTESSYPYEAKTYLKNCRYSTANVGAKISSFQDVASGSESSLQNAVVYRGPVSVAIDASQNSFQLYESGVYYDENCSSENLDHGVLVVGYGSQSGDDYWIVKNSWGTGWGQSGYIWMARNQDNNCGIATAASFPIL